MQFIRLHPAVQIIYMIHIVNFMTSVIIDGQFDLVESFCLIIFSFTSDIYKYDKWIFFNLVCGN